MATRNTIPHPSLSLSLNTHIAFLQNAIISLLAEQAKLSDKIDRLKGLVEELRWETRRDTEMLRGWMGRPSCLSGQFTAVGGVGDVVGKGDWKEGAEKTEGVMGEGAIMKEELEGEVSKDNWMAPGMGR